MITEKPSRNKAILDDILCIAVILICLLDIFPKGYYFFNIVIVLLFSLHHFIEFDCKVTRLDIFVFCVTVFEILFSEDFSRVSLFVVYLFFQSKRLYTKRSLQICLMVMATFFCLVLIAYMFGFNQEYDKVRWNMAQKEYIFERALGFTNPNKCMTYVFSFSCIYILYAKRLYSYIFVWVLNYFLYGYTQCRSVFYAITIIVVILTLLKLFRLEYKKFFIKYFSSFVFLLVFTLAVILPYYFADTDLNALLSGRLSANQEYLEHGVSLFGVSVLEDEIFDNAYLHMILTKGVLYIIFYTWLIINADRKALITNKNIILMIAILLVGYVEVIFLRYMIMFAMGALFNKE